MRSTSQLREVWAPACRLQKARFVFWSGIPVTVDARIVPALAALDAILKRWKYAPKIGQTWGYNCRRITGGSGYSLHAHAIAVDINSLANPYGRRLITDMPRAMVEQILALRTKGGHEVWGWGGNYRGNKDAMHYECVASPAELALGIASEGGETPQDAGKWEEGMALARIIQTKNSNGTDSGLFATDWKDVWWIASFEEERLIMEDCPPALRNRKMIPRDIFDGLNKVRGSTGWPT